MPKQPKQSSVYLVVDVYSHALMGAYPDEETAFLAADNTAAYCLVYEAKVKKVERPAG